MNHIDLFSGIGGFALAAREVWEKDYHNVLFCDNNHFCQEVIKKNFGKDSVIYGDIREITSDTRSEKSGGVSSSREKEISQIGCCDLLTGGFPCQPFSQAGKRRGTEDNRYLWPEMLQVIKDFSPRWVIAENVRGLINISGGLVFEQVCLDLETCGYEVQTFIIPAVAVNAPHCRDRVWIIAHSGHGDGQGTKNDGEPEGQIPRQEDALESERPDCDAREESSPDTECPRRTHRLSGQEQETGAGERRNEIEKPNWERNWLEVALETCSGNGRVDDGLPVELDGFKLTKAGHRVERLRSLGNAIVPQVCIEILKAIKYSEECYGR